MQEFCFARWRPGAGRQSATAGAAGQRPALPLGRIASGADAGVLFCSLAAGCRLGSAGTRPAIRNGRSSRPAAGSTTRTDRIRRGCRCSALFAGGRCRLGSAGRWPAIRNGRSSRPAAGSTTRSDRIRRGCRSSVLLVGGRVQAGNPQRPEQPASGRLYHSVGSHPARMQVFCFARWRPGAGRLYHFSAAVPAAGGSAFLGSGRHCRLRIRGGCARPRRGSPIPAAPAPPRPAHAAGSRRRMAGCA